MISDAAFSIGIIAIVRPHGPVQGMGREASNAKQFAEDHVHLIRDFARDTPTANHFDSDVRRLGDYLRRVRVAILGAQDP
ncbi:hypothetical protein D9M69_717920 [compost metagenome]